MGGLTSSNRESVHQLALREDGQGLDQNGQSIEDDRETLLEYHGDGVAQEDINTFEATRLADPQAIRELTSGLICP